MNVAQISHTFIRMDLITYPPIPGPILSYKLSFHGTGESLSRL